MNETQILGSPNSLLTKFISPLGFYFSAFPKADPLIDQEPYYFFPPCLTICTFLKHSLETLPSNIAPAHRRHQQEFSKSERQDQDPSAQETFPI